MCTAITFHTLDHYFGRNLDFEYDFGESVVITPRNFPLPFRCKPTLSTHYAMIGMAVTEDNYPLYFDATNEEGLSMAGLYFPGNAVYMQKKEGMDNITPFELVPWILGQCSDMNQARKKLSCVNLVNIPFSKDYSLTPLHWIIAKGEETLTVEPTANGIQVYDNPIGILTNNPPFQYHLYNLTNYLNLTREEPINRFAPNLTIEAYSRGMGAMGLPGDLSSSSRFIRAAFTKLNSVCESNEISSVSQFFHILKAVAQQKGCAKVGEGFEKTIYTSCCNADKGIYYYTTYDNSQITAIQMRNADLDGQKLSIFPLQTQPQIRFKN